MSVTNLLSSHLIVKFLIRYPTVNLKDFCSFNPGGSSSPTINLKDC